MCQELKDWVVKSAADNHRTINSEIVARLEESRRAEEKEKTNG